jgi:hypothetical protein
VLQQVDAIPHQIAPWTPCYNTPYFTINLNILKKCCGAVELFLAMCVDRSDRV